MVNDRHLYRAAIQSAVQLMPLIHPFTHTFTHQRRLAAMQGTDQLVQEQSGVGHFGAPRVGSHLLSRIAPVSQWMPLIHPFNLSHANAHTQRRKAAAVVQCTSEPIGSSRGVGRLAQGQPGHFLRARPRDGGRRVSAQPGVVQDSGGNVSSPIPLGSSHPGRFR